MSRPLECKVYVGNLGSQGSKSELERVFGFYGPLTNVWVARKPPGFAFVEFETEKDARDAVKALDGRTVCGVRARVELSSGMSRRGGHNGGGGGGGGYRGSHGGRDDYYDRRRSYRSRSRSRSPHRRYSRSRSRSRDRTRRSRRSRSRSSETRDEAQRNAAAVGHHLPKLNIPDHLVLETEEEVVAKVEADHMIERMNFPFSTLLQMCTNLAPSISFSKFFLV
uniref:serine/arginine-rich splicing factor 3-like n=1 Tax=Styela clava TaxID=7725 RepID=UPI00193AB39F|nr:serine/arginine-rich splicing factor 3-like [Styela clava]